MEAVIEFDSLTKWFGGIKAISECSSKINPGEIVGIIGPNGSGKTTLINLLTGFISPDRGTIRLAGKNIAGKDPSEIAKLGVGRTFQLVRIFFDSSVLENVLIAASTVEKRLEVARKKAEEMVRFVNLHSLIDEKASNLSYGQQRLLELARTLVRDPDIIFLDEPTGGVNPVMVNQLADLIRVMNERGKTFVIIEHNVKFVRQVCKRTIVLHQGQIIAEGRPDEVLNSDVVIEAYLGRLVAK
ncbi:MAG: ABC transporter ATP-binding protein [Candidatus Caldarchaeum sp.]|nr:ABC transporter ATP-binding protein [Candidatus Caldarchaeum sp.]